MNSTREQQIAAVIYAQDILSDKLDTMPVDITKMELIASHIVALADVEITLLNKKWLSPSGRPRRSLDRRSKRIKRECTSSQDVLYPTKKGE